MYRGTAAAGRGAGSRHGARGTARPPDARRRKALGGLAAAAAARPAARATSEREAARRATRFAGAAPPPRRARVLRAACAAVHALRLQRLKLVHGGPAGQASAAGRRG